MYFNRISRRCFPSPTDPAPLANQRPPPEPCNFTSCADGSPRKCSFWLLPVGPPSTSLTSTSNPEPRASPHLTSPPLHLVTSHLFTFPPLHLFTSPYLNLADLGPSSERVRRSSLELHIPLVHSLLPQSPSAALTPPAQPSLGATKRAIITYSGYLYLWPLPPLPPKSRFALDE